MATTLPVTHPPATSARPGRGHLADSITLVAALVTAIGFLGYAVGTGLSPADALAGAAAVIVTQVIPGALVWRVVRPRNGWLAEDVAMGFAIGTALAIVAQIVAGLSRVTWLSGAIPLAVAAVLLAMPATRHRIRSARSASLPWWWGPAVGLTAVPALPQLIGYFTRHELRWPAGAWSPHIDAYLHQALAGELLNRGPVSWPMVAGEDLGYHWFAHAWIAQTARVSGLGLDEVLLRFMPAVMPAILVLAVAAAAVRLSGRPLAGALAALLAVVGGQVNVFGRPSVALPIEPLSPTLALGAPTLVALVVLLAVRWRGEALSGAFVLVPLLAVVAAGTKGSTSPLVVAGLGLAAAAMVVWNRRKFLPVVVDLAVVAGALVLTIVVVFHGSSAGLALGMTNAAKQSAVYAWLGGLPSLPLLRMAVVVTVLAMMTRAAALFALPFSRQARRDPVTWLLVGAVLAGAGAVGVFSHPGRSQYYFAATAIPLMAVGAALGLLALAQRLGTRLMLQVCAIGLAAGPLLVAAPRLITGPLVGKSYDQAWTMLGLGAAIIVVTAAVSALLAPGRARLAAAAGAVALAATTGGMAVFSYSIAKPVKTVWGPVKMTSGLATTQAQIDAARWIRDHSDVDDMVMTNRHCTTPREPFSGCDSRRWLVTAFSERQSLVEGWTATPQATRIAPHGRDSVTVDYWKPDILRLNDGFIAAPTQDAADRLRQLGVRWVYVDHTRPYAKTLEPFATHRFRNQDADVYELLPAKS